ncbi:MAG: serine hydrolase [Anaerolineae bacterium]|nr:serine hydrolase [Anaerolineae bacterium]
MIGFLRLAKIELYKLYKHRLTWWLLVALVVILGLQARSLHNKARDGLDIAGRVDDYMQAHVEMWAQWDIGGALLIAQDGDILFSKGYGLADRAKGIPITPDTIFPLASITKQFTAMAIMQLQEAGKLNVQDTIDAYLPDLPYGDVVTIHHLLTHSSGLPNTAGSSIPTELAFEPGSKASYSNAGYLLLGQIIERASGQPYPDYIQAHIFDPLGMHNSGFDPARIVGRDNVATGYARGVDGAQEVPYPPGEIPGAAGGLYSTANDLYLWDRALYTEKLVSRETLEQILTPTYPVEGRDGYRFGYGWFIDTESGHKSVTHGGTFPGAVGQIVRYVEDDPFRPHAAIILLSNADWTPLDWIVKDLAAILFGEFYEPPAKRSGTIVALAPQLFDRYAGKYEYGKLGMAFSVYRDSERYFVRIRTGSDETAMELYPISETEFLANVGNTEMRFAGDESGVFDQLIVTSNGVELFSARRRDVAHAPAEPVELPLPVAENIANTFSPGESAQPVDYRRAAVLPGSYELMARSFDWTIIALILLGIVLVGNEFSWGTARTVLARGVRRGQLVLAKVVALALVATIYLAAMWIVCTLLGLWATRSLTGTIDWGFVDGAFVRAQAAQFARAWIVLMPLAAFSAALYTWAGKPGPAFSLLFLIYFSSLLAYIFISVVLSFLFLRSGFEPAAFGNTLWAQLIALIPHYNMRTIIYWGNPVKLAEMDRWVRSIAQMLHLPSNPWRAVVVLFIYGAVPLVWAIAAFRRREMTL